MKVQSVLAMFALVVSSPNVAAEYQAGFDIESFHDDARDRPVQIDWWYPSSDTEAVDFNYGLGRGRIVPQGGIAAGEFPLVLLSHGALGSARNYSWLAESLARNGYLVAGISHFGESYVYGEDTVDPMEVLRSWSRPLDISAALTYIGKESRFQNSVANTRTSFVGHSSGGATAMYLAGAKYDAESMARYCRSEESDEDLGCDYAKDTEITFVPPPGPYAERRIQNFIAIDPALGPGFTDFSGVDSGNRFLVIASRDNDFLPFDHHAGRLIAKLPNAVGHVLDQGEGHFIYLNPCENDIIANDLTANGVPLCRDRPGVNRIEVQKELSHLITHFLRLHLDSD